MKLGVVGSGKVGSALGAWAAKLGYEVAFTSKSEKAAREAAVKAGHNSTAHDIAALVARSEMILLTVPFTAIEAALSPARGLLRSPKILVDVSNPVTEDKKNLVLGHTDSGGETVARLFPDISVVKAFNASFAEVYAAQTPKIDNQKLTVFYAGDDAKSKAAVEGLIHAMGFDAVDAGPLHMARCLEPLSLLNIRLGRFNGLGTSIGFSLAKADEP